MDVVSLDPALDRVFSSDDEDPADQLHWLPVVSGWRCDHLPRPPLAAPAVGALSTPGRGSCAGGGAGGQTDVG